MPKIDLFLTFTQTLYGFFKTVFFDSIGGESLAVAQNTYAVNWFKGKELNLVFGLQLSMARLVWTFFKFIYLFFFIFASIGYD